MFDQNTASCFEPVASKKVGLTDVLVEIHSCAKNINGDILAVHNVLYGPEPTNNETRSNDPISVETHLKLILDELLTASKRLHEINARL